MKITEEEVTEFIKEHDDFCLNGIIKMFALDKVKEALILAKTETEHLNQEERNEYFDLAMGGGLLRSS